MNTKIFLAVLVVVLASSLAGLGYYVVSHPRNLSQPLSTDDSLGWRFPITKFPLTGSTGNLAYSDIRDPGGIPQGLPVRLQIPVIGVDSAIEDAFITPDGRMDVPAGSVNVAWFALGPHPGEKGSAVIGGHFGIQNGVKFVFYDLDKLKIGDKIYIVNDKGETLAFVVRSVKSFDRNADATTVFTSTDGIAHLNLITCEGVWNQVNGSYPERLVIFADAIPSEGAAPIKSSFVVRKPRLPSTALAMPTSTPESVVPETVAPQHIVRSPLYQMFIQSVESVFATPFDALVTLLLLVGIILLFYRIIRQ